MYLKVSYGNTAPPDHCLSQDANRNSEPYVIVAQHPRLCSGRPL
jgi:hypothetical protein